MRNLLLLLGCCTFGFAAASTVDNQTGSQSPSSTTSYSVGLAGGVVPRYLGSKDYHAVALPTFAVTLPNGLFASATDGIGARFSSSSGFFGSAALTYDLGRKDENRPGLPGSDHLRGMGDISGSAVSVLQLGFSLTPQISLTSTFRVPLTHRERGITSRTAAKFDLAKTDRDVVSLDVGVLAGTRKYNQTFFGVTGSQALTSGFNEYAAHSGVYGADSRLVWTHKLTSNWAITSAVSVTGLLGDTARSPVVQRRLAVYALSSVNYTF
ncbi:MipA/OmpV family protein [Cupriavidus sp. 2TAF22]|uniref:MipA/OmpV family protein n=1 Tax=unclassified Cupriavidus TaxID=2640874 RepID=UPI003F8F9CAE